jgi:hypothetical protein
MTPRDVDELTEEERRSFQRFMDRDLRAQRRAAAKAGRK